MAVGMQTRKTIGHCRSFVQVGLWADQCSILKLVERLVLGCIDLPSLVYEKHCVQNGYSPRPKNLLGLAYLSHPLTVSLDLLSITHDLLLSAAILVYVTLITSHGRHELHLVAQMCILCSEIKLILSKPCEGK